MLDGYTCEVIKKSPKRSKANQKEGPAFRDEPLQIVCKKQDSGISVNTKSLKSKKEEKKATSIKGKAKSVFMEKSIDLQGSGIYLRKRNREVTEYWDRKQVGDNKTMVFKVRDI